jgi:hypothetical protein
MNRLIPNDLFLSLEDVRGRPFTDLEKSFLTEYVRAKYDVKKAGKKAGLHEVDVAGMVRRLKPVIQELLEVKLLTASSDAIDALSDVLTNDDVMPNAGAKVQAAQAVLDRSGLGKTERVEVEHKGGQGVFIMPAKEEPKIIEGEVVDRDVPG